jgi:hypothetical protein
MRLFKGFYAEPPLDPPCDEDYLEMDCLECEEFYRLLNQNYDHETEDLAYGH